MHGVVEFEALLGCIEVHPCVRVFGQDAQGKGAGGAEKVQQLKGEVHFAGVQVWAVDQAWVHCANFGRRGKRLPVEAVNPHGDVIAMGVEILRGV